MTKDPACGNTPALSRRTFLTALPLTGTAMAVPAEASARDPHPGWLAEWKLQYDIIAVADDYSDEQNAAHARGLELFKLISSIQAQTSEGLAAQLELLLLDNADFWSTPTMETLVETMLASVTV